MLGHADGDGAAQRLAAVQRNRQVLQGLAHLLQHLLGLLHAGGGHQHHEFLSAVAGQGIGAPKAPAQQIGHRLEHHIACGVAVAVVHLFEVVHIQHGQRHRLPCLHALRQLGRHHLVAPGAVVQAGQGIGLGQIAVAALGALARLQALQVAAEMVGLHPHQVQTQQVAVLHQLQQQGLGHGQHPRLGSRQHKGRWRAAVDQRHLAHTVARCHLGQRLGVAAGHAHVQHAVEQHIQALVGHARLQQHLPGAQGEDGALGQHILEHVQGQALEQLCAGNQVRKSSGHEAYRAKVATTETAALASQARGHTVSLRPACGRL